MVQPSRHSQNDGKVQGYFTACNMVPTFYDELRATGHMLDVGLFKPSPSELRHGNDGEGV